MNAPTALRNNRLAQFIVCAVLLNIAVNAVNITRVYFDKILVSYEVYNRVPPQARVFIKTPDELRAIMNIRNNLPPDARILWVPEVFVIANYYIYPRKVFHPKKYDPDEEIVLDAAFIKSRRITHVYLGPDKIMPVSYGERK